MKKSPTKQQLLREIDELRTRLEEAEETLRAIGSGEVDAVVVSGTQGDQVYTLQGADRSYRILMETMGEGAASLSNDGTILYCNRRLAAMLEAPLEKVMGSSLGDYLSPADWKDLERMFQKGDATTKRGEFNLTTAEGNWLPALVSFGGSGVGEGHGICLTVADLSEQKRGEEELRKAHDELETRVRERTGELAKSNSALKSEIEERKKAEQALRELEARANALIRYAPTGIYEIDYRRHSFISVNDAMCRILGYTREELFSIGPSGLLDDDSRARFADRVKRQLAGEKIEESAEFRVRKKDGSMIDALLNISFNVSGDYDRALVVAHDITQRKQAEAERQQLLAEVQAERDKLRTLVSSITDEVWFADAQKKFTLVNPSALREFGLDSAGNGVDVENLAAALEVYHPDGLPRPVEETPPLRALQGEVIRNQEEIVRTPASGKLRYRQVSSAPVRDAGGNIIGSVSVVRDITDRKRMEEELRRSRDELEILVQERTAEKYRQAELLDLTHDAIVVREQDGPITFWNKGAEEMYGWTKEEALGKIMRDLLQTQFPAPRNEIVAKVMQKGRWEGELTHTRKDGTPINVLARWVQQRDEEGRPTGVMLINTDITQRLKLEEQLRQAQKMEAIGTLTGGIAHDFNNILQTIAINADLALLDLPDGSGVRKKIDLILKSGLRGKDLVRQMLLFSRKSGRKQAIITITPLVKETFKLLRSAIPSTIQMELHLKTESDAVYADPSQIQQVIMNLCTNAAYAMKGTTGLIDISLQGVTFGSTDLPEPDMEPGDYLVLSVKDTGSGMGEEVRKRIFDPFFTTKPVGEGTGLGLSVVYGIVKSHKGGIAVSSGPGKGSIFRVYIPKAGSGVPQEAEALKPIPRGKETILLVDDEEIIANSIRNMLGHLGYQVTALMDSQEALKLFSESPSQFDLVITDQTMPFMTGEDLGKVLMNIRPDIPVILCTGYSDMIDAEKARASGFRDFIMKPFTVREGAELVRRVLDERRSQTD